MAKKAKSKSKAKAAAPKRESVKPSEVRLAISESKLKALLGSTRRAQAEITEISGGMGSEIKTAVEKHHLHRKAFRVVAQADRMEPDKLRDFLDCLDHYLDISGLRDRAASAPAMNFEQGDGEEGDEGEGEDNVHRLPTQQAAE